METKMKINEININGAKFHCRMSSKLKKQVKVDYQHGESPVQTR